MNKKAFSLIEFLTVLIVIGLLYIAMADKIKKWIGVVDDAKVTSIHSSIQTSLQNIQTNYMVTQNIDLKNNVEFQGFDLIEDKDELLEYSNDKDLSIKFQKHIIENDKNGVLITLESSNFKLLNEFSKALNQNIQEDNKTITYRVNFDESVAR